MIKELPKTKRTRIYQEIPADELHLRVFMSRRIVHYLFTKKETREKYPLVVKIKDPKTDKERLVNFSAKEEFYGRIPAMRKR